jgi:excisionase family DNA binding protein
MHKRRETVSAIPSLLDTIPETCTKLKCGRSKVIELIRTKKLKGVRIGRLWRVVAASTDELIRGGE